MLSQEQLAQLVSANESLRAQLDELNEILAIREEELALLKSNAAASTELRSRFDSQLDELEAAREQLGKEKQRTIGAGERELELHQELTEAARQQRQYQDMQQQYAYLQAQHNDLQEELSSITAHYMQLRKTASRVGQLESELANSLQERDELRVKLAELELIIRRQAHRPD